MHGKGECVFKYSYIIGDTIITLQSIAEPVMCLAPTFNIIMGVCMMQVEDQCC